MDSSSYDFGISRRLSPFRSKGSVEMTREIISHFEGAIELGEVTVSLTKLSLTKRGD